MIHLDLAGKQLTMDPWFWGIAGGIALTIGLLFVILPKQSGHVWWAMTQVSRPWRVAKPPAGAVIATGCLCLVVSVAMFFGMIETILHR